MDNAKSIAGIVGPALVVMVLSEMKIWNPTLYATQIVPLVYVSGVLLFIAGLAVIRQHNVWTWKWPVVITLIGWLGGLLGLVRMFFPQRYQAQFKNDIYALVLELLLVTAGVFLTYKAYLSTDKPAA